MSQLTLAIIIFVLHLALYITNVIPMTVTALLTSAACLLTGLTTQAESFGGFADGSALIMAGMFVVCTAFTRTQFMNKLADGIFGLAKGSFKKAWAGMIVLAILATNLISSPPAAFAFCVPFCVQMCKKFNVSPTKMMWAVGVLVIGNAGALPGATNIYIATRNVGYFEKYGFAEYAMTIWDYTKGRLPVMLMCMVWAYFYALKVSPSETGIEREDLIGAESKHAPLTPFKEWAAVLIFAAVLFCQIFNKLTGISAGVAAATGAILVVLFGILTEKEAINVLPFSMIAIYAGGLAIATSLFKTGAAEVIGNLMANMLGNTTNGLLLGFVMFFIPFAVTQFMANANVTAFFIPLALMACQSLGADPRGSVILVGSAAMTSFMTPSATVTVPMVMKAGGYDQKYLFKHSWLVTLVFILGYVPWVEYAFPAFPV